MPRLLKLPPLDPFQDRFQKSHVSLTTARLVDCRPDDRSVGRSDGRSVGWLGPLACLFAEPVSVVFEVWSMFHGSPASRALYSLPSWIPGELSCSISTTRPLSRLRGNPKEVVSTVQRVNPHISAVSTGCTPWLVGWMDGWFVACQVGWVWFGLVWG